MQAATTLRWGFASSLASQVREGQCHVARATQMLRVGAPLAVLPPPLMPCVWTCTMQAQDGNHCPSRRHS